MAQYLFHSQIDCEAPSAAFSVALQFEVDAETYAEAQTKILALFTAPGVTVTATPIL
jgi:hypothetical protein